MKALQASRQATRQLALWLIPAAFALTGCEVVKGIFKAGVWVGVLAVVIVLGGAAMLVRMFKA